MKRGGSLDSTLYYIVVVIAMLNIIAYLSIQDWYSVGWLLLSGLCMFVLTQNKTIALVVAILGGALNRSIYVEGMTKEKTKDKKKLDYKALMDSVNGTDLEGLTTKLAENQTNLLSMSKQVEPLVSQVSGMLKQLPEGFLEHAMKNFNKRKQ